MKQRLKLWVGVGTFVVVGAGAIAMSHSDVVSAAWSTLTNRPQVAAEGGEGGEGAESGSEASDASVRVFTPADTASEGGEGDENAEAAPAQACAAIAVEGGGEGGESGGSAAPIEHGAVLYTPANQQRAGAAKFSDRQILANFADGVIIPTYRQLNQSSNQLAIAIQALAATPNEATLKTARQAWLGSRSLWEQSEAYAFGPAASLGYDGALDAWPVNEVDVKAVLNSKDALTEAYVGNLQDTQKGFHTLEFLLFGENNNKSLSDFNQRDLTYLTLLANTFKQTTTNLLQSWTTGVEGYPAYRDEFVNAGTTSTAYPTPAAAAEEIVQGMLGILDELANAKIGKPLEAQNPFLLESRFSNSSLRDFEHNLRSVQYAYLGSTSGQRNGKSLSDYVKSVDPTLDTQVQRYLNASLSTVAAVPAPIEANLCNPESAAKLAIARDSILTLHTLVAQQLLPLMQSE